MVDERFIREFLETLAGICAALVEIDESLMLNHEVLEKILNDTKWYRR